MLLIVLGCLLQPETAPRVKKEWVTGWRRGWDHSRRAVCGLAFTELTGLKVNLEFCAGFDCLGVFSHQTLVFSLFRLELKLPFEFAGASHWPCQTLRKLFNRSL